MKTFILREKRHAQSLIEYLRQHAGPQARAGKPLAVTVEGPTGLLSASTSQMNTEQFAKYMTQVEVFAAQELSVEFAYV